MARLHSRTYYWMLVPVVILALAGVWRLRAAAGHAKQMSDPTRARQEGRAIPVRTTQVRAGQVSTQVGATAVTIPARQITLSIGSSRRMQDNNPVVRTVHVRRGEQVAAGQVLVELDPTHFAMAVEEQKHALAAAQADVARMQAAIKERAEVRRVELVNAAEEVAARAANIEFTKEEFERLNSLYDRGAASLTERLDAATAYSEARAEATRANSREQAAKAESVLGPLHDQAELETALGQLRNAERELALAEDDLSYCTLRSPFAGVAGSAGVTAGQVVNASTSIIQVLQLNPIHVRLDFPQERLASLSIGQEAEVVVDTFPQEVFRGTVVRIPAEVDQQRRVLPVIVEVPNPEHRIRVGVTGYARIRVTHPATTAPAISVMQIGGQAITFVVDESGRAHIRPVQTGAIVEAGVIEIVDGLKAGDEIVVYGQQFLQENDPVDSDWRRWARRD